MPLQIPIEVARRFILGKQGLWPGRRWQGIEGAARAMRAIEHLQLDPLVVIARTRKLADGSLVEVRVDGWRVPQVALASDQAIWRHSSPG